MFGKRKTQRQYDQLNEEKMDLTEKLHTVLQERKQLEEECEQTRRELAQVRSDLHTNIATLSSKLSAVATSEDHWKKKSESNESTMKALAESAKKTTKYGLNPLKQR